MTRLVYSSDAWKLLNGFVSVYKPAGMAPMSLTMMLKKCLVDDLNCMERRVDPRFLSGNKRLQALDPGSSGGPYISQKTLVDNQLRVPPLPAPPVAKLPKPLDSQEQIWEEKYGSIKNFDINNPVTAFDDEDQNEDLDFFDDESSREFIDYSSHPLVLGPGYDMNDIQLFHLNLLTTRASGVLVFGINKAKKRTFLMRKNRPVLTYEVECEFGKHTRTGFSDSPVIAKATWKHLRYRRWRLDQLCSTIEASNQKQAWTVSKVDPQSQEGYELACKGPIKPAELMNTIIYSIRCTEWDLPKFKVRVQCIGVDHKFILDTIAEIGIRLRSHAHVTKLRCSQVGHFPAEDTLLPQELSLQSVLTQIHQNRRMLLSKNLKHTPNFISGAEAERPPLLIAEKRLPLLITEENNQLIITAGSR